MIESAKQGSPTAFFNTPNKGTSLASVYTEYKNSFISITDSQYKDIRTTWLVSCLAKKAFSTLFYINMAKPLSKNSLFNSNTWTNFWQMRVLEDIVSRTHNWQGELVSVWSRRYLQWIQHCCSIVAKRTDRYWGNSTQPDRKVV